MSNGARPRLGFLGVGWIGRHRMAALAESGLCEIVAVADTVPELVSQAQALAPRSVACTSLDELLAIGLDGVVIATPSALHAAQALQAFEQGCAVFCQKPLGRNASETRQVIGAARAADRLLGVDLSYRHLAGMERARALVRSGELGSIYAIDLVFHNAYGPDKAWFYDRALAGGGCVIDLGIHLVDLALWLLDFPQVTQVTSRLFAQGRAIGQLDAAVEDYAAAQLTLATGAVIQLACSWKLPAGCDAVIGAALYGPHGGVALQNVAGSFYDFRLERLSGTQRHLISGPPDAWGGRAAVAWLAQLAERPGFDPAIESLASVAATLDAIYGAA